MKVQEPFAYPDLCKTYLVKSNKLIEDIFMAKIRESRRKAEVRQFSLADGKKHYHNHLSFSEKEALREICAKDFKFPVRQSRHY